MSRIDAALRIENRRAADLPSSKATLLRQKLTWPTSPMDRLVAENLLREAVTRGTLSPREAAQLQALVLHWDEAALPERLVLYRVMYELMGGREPVAGRPAILNF